jgi:hypothetical protein
MNKTILIVFILIISVAGFFIIRGRSDSTPNPKTALAQCLADKGATFYGAYWCPHCNNQKLAFGSRASKKLPYVECALFPSEVSSTASRVLKEYKAGTYAGGYKQELDTLSKSITDHAALVAAGTAQTTDAPAISSIDEWEPSQTEACASRKHKQLSDMGICRRQPAKWRSRTRQISRGIGMRIC